jgi:DNA primase
MHIPDSFIQDVLARTDVVDVVGRYVQLKKAGANYHGLCPFHGEKTPSFTVSPTKQFFHCFGCGKNGNAIGFLMEYAGLGFVEAVQDLAGNLGLSIPQEPLSPSDKLRVKAQKEQKNKVTDALARAAAHYSTHLARTPHAVQYIQKRGLSDAVVQRFQLGYASDSWRGLATVFPDYAAPELREAGLLIEKESEQNPTETTRYDRFRDRIMFPIRNLKGECIGFGGRILDKGEPKYLNSPETTVFSKGRELYGLFEGRSAIDKAGYALVTEGYMDVVALAQMGFENTVATLGTACTEDHIQKLLRFTPKVVFSFDGDAAGRRAATKALHTALPFAQDSKSFHFLFLPPEHDPDSYIRAFGTDAFARLVAAAVPLSQMLLNEARQGCDLDTIEGRSKLASQARAMWQPLPDGAGKRQLLQQIAALVQLGQYELLDLWGMATRGDTSSPNSRSRFTPPSAKNKHSVLTHESGRGLSQTKFHANTHANGSNFTLHPRAPLSGRKPISSRIDRALGILFVHNGFWNKLSAADHAMLCAWSAPYGDVFRWLEHQIMEYGVQTWGTLSLALRQYCTQPHHNEGLAGLNELYALVSKHVTQAGLNPEEEFTELNDIMKRLREDARRQRLSQLVEEAMHNPLKFEEYKRLLAQQKS